MPPKNRLSLEGLEATKAYQTEQLRLRTERRLAQLERDQRELELSKVLCLLSLLWLAGIILFYTRLYLGLNLSFDICAILRLHAF
jgi:hypothetical protein